MIFKGHEMLECIEKATDKEHVCIFYPEVDLIAVVPYGSRFEGNTTYFESMSELLEKYSPSEKPFDADRYFRPQFHNEASYQDFKRNELNNGN